MPARAEQHAAPQQDGPPAHSPSQVSIPAPLAARLDRMGLRGVVAFLLDVGRPFGWLGAQLVLVAQPTLALFGAHKAGADLAAWLEQLSAGSNETMFTAETQRRRDEKQNKSLRLRVSAVNTVARRFRKP